MNIKKIFSYYLLTLCCLSSFITKGMEQRHRPQNFAELPQELVQKIASLTLPPLPNHPVVAGTLNLCSFAEELQINRKIMNLRKVNRQFCSALNRANAPRLHTQGTELNKHIAHYFSHHITPIDTIEIDFQGKTPAEITAILNNLIWFFDHYNEIHTADESREMPDFASLKNGILHININYQSLRMLNTSNRESNITQLMLILSHLSSPTMGSYHRKLVFIGALPDRLNGVLQADYYLRYSLTNRTFYNLLGSVEFSILTLTEEKSLWRALISPYNLHTKQYLYKMFTIAGRALGIYSALWLTARFNSAIQMKKSDFIKKIFTTFGGCTSLNHKRALFGSIFGSILMHSLLSSLLDYNEINFTPSSIAAYPFKYTGGMFLAGIAIPVVIWNILTGLQISSKACSYLLKNIVAKHVFGLS